MSETYLSAAHSSLARLCGPNRTWRPSSVSGLSRARLRRRVEIFAQKPPWTPGVRKHRNWQP